MRVDPQAHSGGEGVAMTDYLHNGEHLDDLKVCRRLIASHLDEIVKLKSINAELVAAYNEYTELLGDEIEELMFLAINHGWETSRFEQGKKCRDRIEAALKRAEER